MCNVGHCQDTIIVKVYKNTKDYYNSAHQDTLLAVVAEKSDAYRYVSHLLDFKKKRIQKSSLKAWGLGFEDDLFLNMEYFEFPRSHVFFKLDLKGRYGIIILGETLPSGLVNSTINAQNWFGNIEIEAFPGWVNENLVRTRIIIVDTYYREALGKYSFEISKSDFLSPSFLSSHLRINNLLYKDFTYDQIIKEGDKFSLEEVLEIITLLNSNYN